MRCKCWHEEHIGDCPAFGCPCQVSRPEPSVYDALAWAAWDDREEYAESIDLDDPANDPCQEWTYVRDHDLV